LLKQLSWLKEDNVLLTQISCLVQILIKRFQAPDSGLCDMFQLSHLFIETVYPAMLQVQIKIPLTSIVLKLPGVVQHSVSERTIRDDPTICRNLYPFNIADSKWWDRLNHNAHSNHYPHNSWIPNDLIQQVQIN